MLGDGCLGGGLEVGVAAMFFFWWLVGWLVVGGFGCWGLGMGDCVGWWWFLGGGMLDVVCVFQC